MDGTMDGTVGGSRGGAGKHQAMAGAFALEPGQQAVIIGAGPAGLAAAYELGRRGIPAVCLEASPNVGGLCQTLEYQGCRFDLGGHRFLTRLSKVDQLWRDTLGPAFLRRPRRSRILYRGRFFRYPVDPLQAAWGLGPLESARILAAYLHTRAAPRTDTHHFEGFTVNRFGRRLYEHFFQHYTEKVWGIPCREISSDWGAQRIQGLSLYSTLKSALLKPRHGEIRSLVEAFDYPRLGPGQLYDALAHRAEDLGVAIHRDHQVTGVGLETRQGQARVREVVAQTPGGPVRFPCGAVLSSMPITELVKAIQPGLDARVLEAASALTYRAMVFVNLIVSTPSLPQDTWLYISDPHLRLGRVQFFRNWSPDMSLEAGRHPIGCEYFVDEGDDLWQSPDQALLDLARSELSAIGLVKPHQILGGFVLRVPRAYPVFRVGYAAHLNVIRQALQSLAGLQVMGRYGMFRYNNMDHSVLTGLLAAANLAGEHHDVWNVNTDQDYLEA